MNKATNGCLILSLLPNPPATHSGRGSLAANPSLRRPGPMRARAGMMAMAAISLTTITTAHAQAVLGAEVIRQSFAGNTAEFVGQANALAVFWDVDGSQRMENKALGPDRGVWRITADGEFCGKWQKLRQGAESCAPVLDLGGGVYQWGNAKFRVLLGNPKGL